MKKIKLKVSKLDFDVIREMVKAFVCSEAERENLVDAFYWEVLFKLHRRLAGHIVGKKNVVSLTLSIPEVIGMMRLFNKPLHYLDAIVARKLFDMLEEKAFCYVYEINSLRRNLL